MKKLYFIRHGESEANIKSLFAGRWDVRLTNKGRAQALLAGQSAELPDLDLIVSSPLLRARETAEIIANEIGYAPDKILFSDLFMERDYGELQGKSFANIQNVDFEKVAGIETISQLTERTLKALEFLKNLEGRNILLVGHGTAGRTLRQLIKDLPEATEVPIEQELPNAQIVRWV